jgi:hypothetical protein
MSVDTKCVCGWLLPFSVFAHRNERILNEDSLAVDSVVALVCPNCARGHSLYSTQAAAKMPDVLAALTTKVTKEG